MRRGFGGLSRSAAVRCTANMSKTNSTYEAITGLSVQLGASKRYEICVCVAVTTGIGGTKIRSALSSAGVTSGSRIFYQIVDSTASPSVFILAGSLVGSTNIEIYNDVPAGVATLTIWMDGIVATQAAATLSIQGAQNTTDADPTIFLANSFLKVTELD